MRWATARVVSSSGPISAAMAITVGATSLRQLASGAPPRLRVGAITEGMIGLVIIGRRPEKYNRSPVGLPTLIRSARHVPSMRLPRPKSHAGPRLRSIAAAQRYRKPRQSLGRGCNSGGLIAKRLTPGLPRSRANRLGYGLSLARRR